MKSKIPQGMKSYIEHFKSKESRKKLRKSYRNGSESYKNSCNNLSKLVMNNASNEDILAFLTRGQLTKL